MDKEHYTIQDIEAAINYWQSSFKSAASTNHQDLSPQATALSEIYGAMIYQRASKVHIDLLTETQRQALAIQID